MYGGKSILRGVGGLCVVTYSGRNIGKKLFDEKNIIFYSKL